MDRKRKYTKKNKEYWGNKEAVSHASVNEQELDPWLPLETSYSSGRFTSKARSTRGGNTITRQNRIANSDMPNSLDNIRALKLPYSCGKSSSEINIKEAVELCQKAYANIGAFRNSIDVMTEFSSAEIHLQKGSEKSRKLVAKFLEKINISSLTEQFFREYFRSGNVFIYRFDGSISVEKVSKVKKNYTESASKLKIPLKYTIINPAEIALTGASSIGKGLYKQVLSQYQLLKLQSKSAPEDLEVFNSLPADIKKQINDGSFGSQGISVQLNGDRLATVFYKKQDYEPFAVPFGYAALNDLNHKIELKKIDQAISRTIQQVVFLVTMGAKKEEGGINKKAMEAMQGMLQNETVGRTIVSDYTTEMQFIIPDIGEILNPEKYKIINEDIQESLQNLIFSTGEKFANQNVKVKVFMERLKEGRRMFLKEFLQPEIDKICRTLGFKLAPIARFQEVDLKDEVQVNRVYLRLLELGVLDAEQTFKAMETGILPDESELMESQKKYKKLREDGYFNPLVGGTPPGEEGVGGPNPNSPKNGRPPGSSTPQTTKNVSPIGESKASRGELFSLKKLKDIFIRANRLISKSENALASQYGVEELTIDQASFAFDLASSIIETQKIEDWNDILKLSIEDPENTFEKLSGGQQYEKIKTLSEKFNTDNFQAAMLYHSEIQKISQ